MRRASLHAADSNPRPNLQMLPAGRLSILADHQQRGRCLSRSGVCRCHDVIMQAARPFIAVQAAVEYALEGSIAVAGSGITWLRDKLQLIQSAAESEDVAASVSGTEGKWLLPGLLLHSIAVGAVDAERFDRRYRELGICPKKGTPSGPVCPSYAHARSIPNCMNCIAREHLTTNIKHRTHLLLSMPCATPSQRPAESSLTESRALHIHLRAFLA